MVRTAMRKPEIAYPCPWEYRIIGTSDELIRAAVAEVVGDVAHTLRAARVSRSGRFVSFSLELVVRDEAHRLTIYEALCEHGHIKIVL